jgi:tetratricopeptide (TPR) repeat protein
LGREDEAIVALERAEQLEPKSPDPSFELGKLYGSKQDWPQARQAFEHVIQLSPQFAAAHYQLSRVYTHLGLREDAQHEAQKTEELVSKQRDDALRKQRERGTSFQPQDAAASSPKP